MRIPALRSTSTRPGTPTSAGSPTAVPPPTRTTQPPTSSRLRGNAIVTKVVQSGSANATLGFSTTIPNGRASRGRSRRGVLRRRRKRRLRGWNQPQRDDCHDPGRVPDHREHRGERDGLRHRRSRSPPARSTRRPRTRRSPQGSRTGPRWRAAPTFTFGFNADRGPRRSSAPYDGGDAHRLQLTRDRELTGSDTRSSGERHPHVLGSVRRDTAGNPDVTPDQRTFTVLHPASTPTPPETAITSGPAEGSTVTSSAVDVRLQLRRDARRSSAPTTAAPSRPARRRARGRPAPTRERWPMAATPSRCARGRGGERRRLPGHPHVHGRRPRPRLRRTPRRRRRRSPRRRRRRSSRRRNPVTVELAFSSRGRSTFACRVDGGPTTGCSSPAKLKLGKGKHTISVVATDTVGQRGRLAGDGSVKVKKKKEKKPGGGGKGNGGGKP